MRRNLLSALLSISTLSAACVFGISDEALSQNVSGKVIWENQSRYPIDITISDYSKNCITDPGDKSFTVAKRERYQYNFEITSDCDTTGGAYLKWDFVQKRSNGWLSNSYLKASIAYDETYGSRDSSEMNPQNEFWAKISKEIWIVPTQRPMPGNREWFRAQCTSSLNDCMNTKTTGDGHVAKIIIPTVSGESQAVLGLTNRFGR